MAHNVAMEQSKGMRKAELEVRLGLLQTEEHRLQAIISNPLTAPEILSRASTDLGRVLGEIRETANELTTIQL